MNAPHN